MTGDMWFVAVLLHLWGDYVLQSQWMAENKTRRAWPCLVHVLIYTSLFLFLTRSWPALVVIGVTHYAIDRRSLARYLIWFKNCVLGPVRYYPARWQGAEQHAEWWEWQSPPWHKCTMTGYRDDAPLWRTFWLYVAVDNTLHLTINWLALRFL